MKQRLTKEFMTDRINAFRGLITDHRQEILIKEARDRLLGAKTRDSKENIYSLFVISFNLLAK